MKIEEGLKECTIVVSRAFFICFDIDKGVSF